MFLQASRLRIPIVTPAVSTILVLQRTVNRGSVNSVSGGDGGVSGVARRSPSVRVVNVNALYRHVILLEHETISER